MKIYLVGGAVRDSLLEIPIAERDWVVVGATEQEMLERGFRRVDDRFPVYRHPESGEEYALARRETKTGPGYKGFVVDSSPAVTLEQDLARRDLTINAMARDAEGRLIDPFGGRDDLDAGLLRHVTSAFVEDPVRLLRIARFAAKLGEWGFRVAHPTHGLLKGMARSEDLEHLTPERTWREMRAAFGEPQPWRFFEVLQRCGALPRVIPALRLGEGEEPAHGGEPATDSPLAALRRGVAGGAGPAMRFAIAFADAVRELGRPAVEFCRGLRAERPWCDALDHLVRAREAWLHGRRDAAGLLDFLQAHGGLKSQEPFEQRLIGLAALHPESSPELDRRLRPARELALAVSAAELRAAGLTGAALGAALRQARLARIERGLAETAARTG